jgi:hypothetical protein
MKPATSLPDGAQNYSEKLRGRKKTWEGTTYKEYEAIFLQSEGATELPSDTESLIY